MKRTGLIALACTAMFTVACGGDARDDANSAAVGTSGADTSQSAGFDNRNLESTGDAPARIGASADGDFSAVGTSGQTRTEGAEHGASADARHFAKTAAMSNNAEIELGKLAQERAQSPDVKRFGQMMVTEHTKANDELKQAVSGQNVDMNAGEMDQKHETLMARLRTLRGAEFDREYMRAMVDGHKEVRSMLQSRANSRQQARSTAAAGDRNARTAGGANPTGTSGASTQLDTAVDQWASKTLPAVEKHLTQAEQIHAKVEGTSGNRTGNSGTTTPRGDSGAPTNAPNTGSGNSTNRNQ